MPPPRGAAGTAAVNPMDTTRARSDPLRRIGNGNAVARGLDLTRVGILSDRELAFFRRLAYAGSQAEEEQLRDVRKQEEDRRRELSKARTASWPDTIEAKQDRFLQSQKEAREAAEKRQIVLDELYVEKAKEEHLSIIAKQQLLDLKEDPRGRNLRSVQLLNEALKVRAEQIAYKETLKKEEQQRSVDLQREYQLQLWGDEAEKLHQKLEVRQRNAEEKNANLETVLYQMEERRRERRTERDDRKRIEQEAVEERAEQMEEDALRHARELEQSAYNISNSRPAQSKAQKLGARLASSVNDEADMRAEQQKMENMKRWTMERQEKKQATFEHCKEAALQKLLEEAAPEMAPKYRTQEIFEVKGTSFLQRLYDDAERRQKVQHEDRLQIQFERETEVEGKAAMEQGNSFAGTSGAPFHGAATTRAGFLSQAEEKAFAEEMRHYPEQLRAEEAEKAAARRAEAKRIEQIQKLQAEEKRENARRAVEARREESRQQKALQEKDDARYRAYIASELPADVHPVLQRRAMQML